MRLEIDIPEHQYNNIMAIDSVSLGRAPYKGIIMYAINAIKQGKILQQEPTTKKDCNTCTHSNEIDGSNCYSCVKDMCNNYDPTTKNDLGVDCISRTSALDSINWAYNLSDAYQKINDLPSVTPQEPTDKKFTKADIDAIVKAINEGWELRVNEILGNIRAEIEFEVDHRTNMLCAEDVFEILDRHKAEQEET